MPPRPYLWDQNTNSLSIKGRGKQYCTSTGKGVGRAPLHYCSGGKKCCKANHPQGTKLHCPEGSEFLHVHCTMCVLTAPEHPLSQAPCPELPPAPVSQGGRQPRCPCARSRGCAHSTARKVGTHLSLHPAECSAELLHYRDAAREGTACCRRPAHMAALCLLISLSGQKYYFTSRF